MRKLSFLANAVPQACKPFLFHRKQVETSEAGWGWYPVTAHQLSSTREEQQVDSVSGFWTVHLLQKRSLVAKLWNFLEPTVLDKSRVYKGGMQGRREFSGFTLPPVKRTTSQQNHSQACAGAQCHRHLDHHCRNPCPTPNTPTTLTAAAAIAADHNKNGRSNAPDRADSTRAHQHEDNDSYAATSYPFSVSSINLPWDP